MQSVGQLIALARSGSPEAVDRLFEATYQELRALAHRRLRRSGGGAVLDTTVLVNECYVRLAKLDGLPTEDRAFFLSYAAKAMRSIVIDIVRQRAAERRGGGALHVTLDTGIAGRSPVVEADVLRIHEALDALGQVDARLMQVVEMRYFAGLTFEEIATSLGVTERTARRDWQKARLFLHAELTG